MMDKSLSFNANQLRPMEGMRENASRKASHCASLAHLPFMASLGNVVGTRNQVTYLLSDGKQDRPEIGVNPQLEDGEDGHGDLDGLSDGELAGLASAKKRGRARCRRRVKVWAWHRGSGEIDPGASPLLTRSCRSIFSRSPETAKALAGQGLSFKLTGGIEPPTY